MLTAVVQDSAAPGDERRENSEGVIGFRRSAADNSQIISFVRRFRQDRIIGIEDNIGGLQQEQRNTMNQLESKQENSLSLQECQGSMAVQPDCVR